MRCRYVPDMRDCTFIDSDVGIRFKSAMGRGGVVEYIYLENILMAGIQKECLTMIVRDRHRNVNL